MRYAKLVNGYPAYHGIRNPIINPNGSKTVTKNAQRLLAAGFLPVVETPAPEEGAYTCAWQDTGSAIVQTWTELPTEAPEVTE